MILETELKRLKDLVNKLIKSATKKIELLDDLKGIELIKNEKMLTDILNKLVKLTIDINKSYKDQNILPCLKEDDEKIIDQFYQNYQLKKHDTKRQIATRRNIKK